MGARSSTAEEIISWIAGHRAPGVAATYTAAVKACGDGATLSGKAPAYLWAPFGAMRPPPPAELTAPDTLAPLGDRNLHKRVNFR